MQVMAALGSSRKDNDQGGSKKDSEGVDEETDIFKIIRMILQREFEPVRPHCSGTSLHADAFCILLWLAYYSSFLHAAPSICGLSQACSLQHGYGRQALLAELVPMQPRAT